MKSIIKNKEIITTSDIGKMSGGTTNTAPSTIIAACQDMSVFEKFDSTNVISEEQYH